jgi:proteasome lid subunit RPN8/RPN11
VRALRLQKPWCSPEIVDQILEIGREESPAEACGVITPDLHVVRLPNRHETSPTDSFVIASEDLVNAIQEFVDRSKVDPTELQRDHFMVWHTHPAGQVGPSRGDIEMKIPGFQYVVVTLPDGPATIF